MNVWVRIILLLGAVLAAPDSLCVAGAPTSAPAAQSDAAALATTEGAVRRWSTQGGTLTLRVNDDLLGQFGARFSSPHAADRFGRVSYALGSSTLQFSAYFGTIQAFSAGALATRSGFTLTRAGRTRRIDRFTLAPAADLPRALQLGDAQGRVWFIADRLMYRMDTGAGRLRMPTVDLRIGPALAAWLGQPDSAGMVVAELTLDSALEALDPAPAQAKTCAVPEWHGSNGKLTDVRLEYFDVQQVRCRRSDAQTPPFTPCDGPAAAGGNDDGDVVFAPSASLRNTDRADTADVPWYEKFLPGTPAPPYGNDQHPVLSWNLYRIDAAGNIRQLGRSGAKHAWFTTNEGCSDPSCSGGSVLGRGCGDVYTTGSNDLAFYLGPRSEIVPARGWWGRCGSIFDDVGAGGQPGCDGAQDYTDPPLAQIGWLYRLVVRESMIEHPANDGARFLFEAGYVVRDDIDIENTMGWLEVASAWTGFTWALSPVGSQPFHNGPAIDAWVAPGAAGNERHERLDSSEGHARVAVRVQAAGAGLWRYDYTVMNLDFARALTSGSEPDLRVLDARGFGGLRVPLDAGGSVGATTFTDSDVLAANDWSVQVPPPGGAPANVTWEAPAGTNTLDWGTLFRFSLVVDAPPVLGSVVLQPARAGMPADYSVVSLVPGAPPLFADGFE
jgi:hypothetical protein